MPLSIFVFCFSVFPPPYLKIVQPPWALVHRPVSRPVNIYITAGIHWDERGSGLGEGGAEEVERCSGGTSKIQILGWLMQL